MELSSYDNVNKENIIFNKIREFNIKDTKKSYSRIPIEIKYGGKLKGPLILETPFLFSFGLSKNLDKNTGKTNGFTIPICLWKRDSKPSDREKEFYDVVNIIKDLCDKHLEKYENILPLHSPFYYKQVEYVDKKGKKKTKIDDTSAPILYAKVIYSEKSKKFLSLFNKVDPMKYLDQNCRVKLALVFEGIYISDTTTSLQIKVHECFFKDMKPRKSLITVTEESEEDD